MNIQELETVRRLNLPIKFFVLNNNGYVSIRNTQNTHFKGKLVASGESSGLTLPSLEKNAYAYDIPYSRIETPENIHAQLTAFMAIEGPAICEIIARKSHDILMTIILISFYTAQHTTRSHGLLPKKNRWC
jgi:acetolactate synthase-1/2/3 large subunit